MFVKSSLQVIFAVLSVISVVFGCTPTPGTGKSAPGVHVTYSKAGPELPVLSLSGSVPERTSVSRRSVPVGLSGDPESFFLLLDDSDDGQVDACEWLRAPFETRLRDFANLVEDIDLDGDDAVSWDEFKVVKVAVHKTKGLTPTPPSQGTGRYIYSDVIEGLRNILHMEGEKTNCEQCTLLAQDAAKQFIGQAAQLYKLYDSSTNASQPFLAQRNVSGQRSSMSLFDS